MRESVRCFPRLKWSTEIECDILVARYYQANLGRFMAVDPSSQSASIGDPQSWNRYSYVRNNPMLNLDPDGRDLMDVVSGAANSFGSDMLGKVVHRNCVRHFGLLRESEMEDWKAELERSGDFEII